MTGLMVKIEEAHRGLEGWADLKKAHTLAAIVIALRPETVLEVGVYGGKSFLPMALACKEVGRGMCYAVDPWQTEASVAEQPKEHADHWGKVDHEKIYNGFMEAVRKLGVAHRVRVLRQKSDDVDLSKFQSIELLSIDGNHGPQALRDVKRFCPLVPVGGICVLDDLDWPQVVPAENWILANGFVKLYPLGTGAVYSRKSL